MCQKWRPIQSVDGSTGVITNIDSDGVTSNLEDGAAYNFTIKI